MDNARMCGICGVYAPTEDVDEGLVRRMNRAQHHRGPDSEGYRTFPGVGLGVKRLKIIDLATGDQPIGNEDGTVWVVYNGEIYNFPELRKRLASNGHTFRTHSDTEVIVHLYEDKGDAFLEDLNGMFALALWDDRQKRLVLARDRLGIKPLYYRWDGERLVFASEIKGILADPEVPRAVDPNALRDYLTFQNVFGDKTLFEGIRQLEPAKMLIGDGGRVTVRPYWDLTFQPGSGDNGTAAKEYGRLLEEAVRMQLISDVPLGAHLSGGIDSSSIVAIAGQRKEGLSTFSIRFKDSEFDEGEYIRAVSDLAGTDHHEAQIDPRTFPHVFPMIMHHLDEPRVGPSVFPQWFLAQLAREHVTVVLTGHGGDELFAGYPAHLVAALDDGGLSGENLLAIAKSSGRLWSEGLKRIVGLPIYARKEIDLRRYGHEAVFKPDELARLLPPEDPTTAQAYDPRRELDKVLARCTAKSELDRLLYLEVKTYLPSLLLVEDRMSMAHSLEDRVPILDHRIAEFSARVPSSAKVHGLTLKNIPRSFAATRLPKKVIDHRKTGFELPIGEWFRTDLRPYVERAILDGGCEDLGLDMDVVRTVVRSHMQRGNGTSQVWSLLNLAVWQRVVLEGRTTG
ncbi:MAG TPA: asparagine synthase (glutamine-hydrolyzing) [Thermoplasmata archaeon]|jgi:asparagine synthase (glutamine-hydrolysing)|nr:asparagine synthase (glutamine-hydrolyzing) [Thermoplasmata archaeon]